MKYEFKSIKIFNNDENIPIANQTICFHGDVFDDRGLKARELNSENQYVYIKYNDEQFNLKINNESFDVRDENYIHKISTISLNQQIIIIDTTTLNIVDILYILKALKHNHTVQKIQMLYVEPKEYSFKNNSVSQFDDFTLSSAFKEFPPVPGFTIMTYAREEYDELDEEDEGIEREEVELIAFLGFEKARLGHIFRADDGATYHKFTPVIPLPGFRPGWENRTLDNHLKFFAPQFRTSQIEYVSANNPYQSYKLLKDFSRTRKKFRIAPIGTKPNSIGCAIFLINNEDNDDVNSGLLFDFPVKLEKRSKGIGKINLYTLYKEITS